MSLSKFEAGDGQEAWPEAVHGAAKSDMTGATEMNGTGKIDN